MRTYAPRCLSRYVRSICTVRTADLKDGGPRYARGQRYNQAQQVEAGSGKNGQSRRPISPRVTHFSVSTIGSSGLEDESNCRGRSAFRRRTGWGVLARRTRASLRFAVSATEEPRTSKAEVRATLANPCVTHLPTSTIGQFSRTMSLFWRTAWWHRLAARGAHSQEWLCHRFSRPLAVPPTH